MSEHEPRTTNNEEDDEISLLDHAIVLAKHKKVILGLPFVVAVIAAGISFFLPNIYTATTKIFPPQGQSASSAMLAQLGGLAGLVGAGGGGANQSYIAILNSRTMKDKLIQRFDLIKESDTQHPSQARTGFPEDVTITGSKDGFIIIQVDGRDPKRVADIANAYVDELGKFTQVLAVTDASRRRLFFERQFVQIKGDLAKAEALARQALERGGLVNVDEQGRSTLTAISGLRAQITAKEVQIGAMRAFAADHNPELRRAQQELESLKRKLADIEVAGGAKPATTDPIGQSIGNLSLFRDLKYQEALLELIGKQYELAKIDEAKDASIIQVLDNAIAAKSPSKPKRVQIVLVSALVALVAGILWAFVFEAMAKAGSDPRQALRLQEIKRHLTRR